MATDSPTEHEMNERAEIAEAKLEALLDITKAPTTNYGWPYEKTLHDQNKALRDRIVKLRDALEDLKCLVEDERMKSESDNEEVEYWVSDHSVQHICDEALAADDAAEKG